MYNQIAYTIKSQLKNYCFYIIIKIKITITITITKLFYKLPCAYTIKSKLKKYFIDYYIKIFWSCDNFFDILLVFVSFLQTYCDTYLSLACSFNLSLSFS